MCAICFSLLFHAHSLVLVAFFALSGDECRYPDLNRKPSDYDSAALPIELYRQAGLLARASEGVVDQEPVTVSAFADPHWTRQESNLKPPGVPGLCLVELLVLSSGLPLPSAGLSLRPMPAGPAFFLCAADAHVPAREDLKGWFELLFSLALQTGNQPRSLMNR